MGNYANEFVLSAVISSSLTGHWPDASIFLGWGWWEKIKGSSSVVQSIYLLELFPSLSNFSSRPFLESPEFSLGTRNCVLDE